MHRYTRLDDEVELSNERYLDDVQSQQQVALTTDQAHIDHVLITHCQLLVVCVSQLSHT